MSLYGVDISSFQSGPGEWVPEAGEIDFACVKLTELSAAGPYVDPDAAADWQYLGEQGKMRVAYLFGHPGMSVTNTVALFEGTLNALGFTDDDAIMLDFEVTDGLPPNDVAAWAQAVCGLLRRDLDRLPLVYTFLAFAWAGNCEGLGDYPLFIADPSAPPGKPTVPGPWSSFVLHQYSITDPIDRDIAVYESKAAMAAALGRPQPQPDPAPAPIPVTGDDDMMIDLSAVGDRVVLAPWASADGKPGTPYTHLALVLTGETGTQVTVTIWRGAQSFPHVHELTSGVATSGDPAHGWDGVTMLTVARTDQLVDNRCSAVLSRW